MVDFRGTVLMPEAKGQAVVESKRGRTEIEVSIEKLLRAHAIWGRIPDLHAVGDHSGRRAAQYRRSNPERFR